MFEGFPWTAWLRGARDPLRALGRLERDVMEIVWRGGEPSVREVQTALTRPIAYTTVMTTLKILEEKRGVLRRTKCGRAYVYEPLVSRDAACRSIAGDLARRVFRGSVKSLVLSLIDTEPMSAADIAEVKAAIPDCARRANVEMRIAGEWQFGNETFDPGCVRLIREAAQRLGVAHRDILSQAGHDAYYISRIAPTAMIFTPCRDGISHNEAEHADLDHTVPGVNVLLHAVLARANR